MNSEPDTLTLSAPKSFELLPKGSDSYLRVAIL